jgi:hypothetical protein
MSIAELAGNYLAEKNEDQKLEERDEAVRAALVRVAHTDLAAANSAVTDVVSQVKAFVEWLNAPQAEFADRSSDGDKFAALIELSRRYQECNRFYLSEVGVNSTTIWRWANKKSRPSRYIGKRVVLEVKSLIANVLWQLCWNSGLTPDLPIGVRKHPEKVSLDAQAAVRVRSYA